MNRNDQPAGFVTRGRRLVLNSLFALCVLALCPAGGLHAADNGTVITIGGTGSALGSMKEMARAFRQKRPEVAFRFAPSLGSTGGIKAVLAGALDLALSARPLSDDERKQGAASVEYARTPFIFVTSHKGRAWDLTPEQLVSIYAGETKAWPDGAPLRLILRPAGDVDTVYQKAMSPAMDKAVQAALSREGMVTAVTDQETADMIRRIRGGFGALTLTQLVTEKRPLKPLRLNGVFPSLRTLADGSYPYYKTYVIAIGPKTGREAQAFIEFINSPEGRSVLTRTGNLPARGNPAPRHSPAPTGGGSTE
jgi:phosphate transport system substrate-binding protein